MYVYTATIGRNVKDWGAPMHDALWETFQDRVSEIMAGHVQEDDFLEIHRGTGEWEGVPEDSAMITVLRNEPLDEHDLHTLRYQLRLEATSFGQEAIALTIGQSELLKRVGVRV